MENEKILPIPISRTDMYMSYINNMDIKLENLPSPITRKDMYLSMMCGMEGITLEMLPEPITREEMYLLYMCQNGVSIEKPLKGLFIYKEGDLCEGVSGGWAKRSGVGTTAITNNADHLYIKSSHGYALTQTVGVGKAIPTNGYKYLVFDMSYKKVAETSNTCKIGYTRTLGQAYDTIQGGISVSVNAARKVYVVEIPVDSTIYPTFGVYDNNGKGCILELYNLYLSNEIPK